MLLTLLYESYLTMLPHHVEYWNATSSAVIFPASTFALNFRSFRLSRANPSLQGIITTFPVSVSKYRIFRNVNPRDSLTIRVFLSLMTIPSPEQIPRISPSNSRRNSLSRCIT